MLNMVVIGGIVIRLISSLVGMNISVVNLCSLR